MRVAVTGGSGVVGSAVVRHLVSAGHDVRALARSSASVVAIERLGAVPVHGDVLDEPSTERLVDGCDTVFHVAGVNELCSRDRWRMWRVNVEGTRIVVDACTRMGVGRMVHTSSVVTIGHEGDAPGDESSAHRGHFLSEYERSKWEAERVVLSPGREFEVVSVNPASVQGPGRSSGSGALLLTAARGTPFAVDTTISVVDIDDCARGHLLAAERGRPGQRYILSGATLTVRELISIISTVTSRHRGPFYVRPGVVRAAAPVVETMFRLLGRQAPLCPESARVLLSGNSYDGSRATEELGLEYTPIEVTLERTIDWFRDQDLL